MKKDSLKKKLHRKEIYTRKKHGKEEIIYRRKYT